MSATKKNKMAKRKQLHEQIQELSRKISETNSFLTGQAELSMLDIDLLRKTTIEIYDAVNQLRMAKYETTEEQEEKEKEREDRMRAEKEALEQEQKEKEREDRMRAEKGKALVPPPVEAATDLAGKFSSTPIPDIKRAISIAKKFEYINALFNGSVEHYTYAIHHINNLEDGTEAMNYLLGIKAERNWDDEDKNFLELADLVRRRFL